MFLRSARLSLLVLGALFGCALKHPPYVAVDDVAAVDATAEASADVTVDAPMELATDTPIDAPTDLSVEVTADAPIDLLADLGPDLVADAERDAAVDVPVEVGVDAPVEVGVDAPVEVGVDAPDVVIDGPPDVVCSGDRVLCGSACVDPLTDSSHCGRCGTACVSPETCTMGVCACASNRRQCAGACVDVRSSDAHCGSCGNACASPETCQSGTCGCSGGRVVCAGACVNVSDDEDHCGRCGNACGEGTCSSGTCGCGGGRTWCAGRCFNLDADGSNCGACGNRCMSGVCTSGRCETAGVTCAPGTADCNGSAGDACETNTASTVNNCGSCGRSCASSQRCVAGVCAAASSCNEIHTLWPVLPTGQYDIRPDGVTTMTRVWCDMTTSGGGWTVVYQWPGSVNLAMTSMGYDVDLPTLRAMSTQVLLAYRDASRRVTDGNWARFAIPAAWVSQSPFVPERVDVAVMASIGDAPMVATTLRYGYREFGNDCESNWVSGRLSGRVCLTRTRAPFFNGFATLGYLDYCCNSDRSWADRLCSDTRRFSIAVR